MLLCLLMAVPAFASGAKEEKKGNDLDVKEVIFEHLGDGYGWEVPFSHTRRIPLPVIVRAQDGKWFTFSSADLRTIQTHVDENGKEIEHAVPMVKNIERDGKTYRFQIATEGSHKDKVVQLLDNGQEYRPWDFSITKNVLALFITVSLVIWMVMGLKNYYKRRGLRAPRKGMGFFELVVQFVYYDTIKAALGDNAKRFAPYLLTAFFFILTMNLVGLVVIFPGGANLTGNIAVTLVLALCTFVITNVLGTRHYWKEILWPDVPIWLKCPLPIMQLIEIFGIFTKPAALCVRLFANMMGGHMIVITLTLLIFIFAAFGAAAAGAASVISVLFSIFMLLLDVLVSFIQAYVFTLLSALFIAMSQVREEEHKVKEDANNPVLEAEDKNELAEEKEALRNERVKIDAV